MRSVVPRRYRQQGRKRIHGVVGVGGDATHHDRSQLLKALFGRVLAPEARRPFKVGDHRAERAVQMVRQAKETQSAVSLAETIKCRLNKPRLSNPRLAANQRDATFAFFRLAPSAYEQLQFIVAAEKRGRRRAQRFKAAVDHALAEDFARSARVAIGQISGQIDQVGLGATRFARGEISGPGILRRAPR